ncbi:ATP-dependent zinc metalloprotease FTSH 4, mitochondrial [Rhizoclosmatium sp. JEL0117]|nr:ATP-dependent zinc metalloprotease FTSH 4, mitochondrial [Rhizoclosmatium sp. JEL0117]
MYVYVQVGAHAPAIAYNVWRKENTETLDAEPDVHDESEAILVLRKAVVNLVPKSWKLTHETVLRAPRDDPHAALMPLSQDAYTPFDPKTEKFVLLPELMLIFAQKMAEDQKRALEETEEAKKVNPDVNQGQLVILDYNSGTYVNHFGSTLLMTLDSFETNPELRNDANRDVFLRIMKECFVPWAIRGFRKRPAGLLLHGPPGNGKSFLVFNYIQKYLKFEFTSENVASSRFSSSKVGEGEAKMRAEADICKNDRTKLYVMFIDEIDSIGGDRNLKVRLVFLSPLSLTVPLPFIKENQGYKTDYLNQLLAIIGQPNYSNLFVIGATNYKARLDDALIRDGRLEKHYYLPSLTRDRRLAHFSSKLASVLNAVYESPIFSFTDVETALELDVVLMGLLERNTINFTFAQFDGFCLSVESAIKREKWIGSPQILEDILELRNGASPLFLNVLLRRVLATYLKPCIEEYIQTSSLDNLKYNRQFVDTSVSSDAVVHYADTLYKFVDDQVQSYSAIARLTGRYIVNLSNSESEFPRFFAELAQSPFLANTPRLIESVFACKDHYFSDSIATKMIQPLIKARGYEYVQIIDRDSVNVDDESSVYDALVEKYEEGLNLGKTGINGLIIISLSDLLGQIFKFKTVEKTSDRVFVENVVKTDEAKRKEFNENKEVKNSETQQITSDVKNALGISSKEENSTAMEQLQSRLNRVEFSNSIVDSKSLQNQNNLTASKESRVAMDKISTQNVSQEHQKQENVSASETSQLNSGDSTRNISGLSHSITNIDRKSLTSFKEKSKSTDHGRNTSEGSRNGDKEASEAKMFNFNRRSGSGWGGEEQQATESRDELFRRSEIESHISRQKSYGNRAEKTEQDVQKKTEELRSQITDQQIKATQEQISELKSSGRTDEARVLSNWLRECTDKVTANEVNSLAKTRQTDTSEGTHESRENLKTDSRNRTYNMSATKSVVCEVRTSKDQTHDHIIEEELLHPKILDVVARFAGATSTRLNAFNTKNGPDILFIVEHENVDAMLKRAIGWGSLKPERPFFDGVNRLTVSHMHFANKDDNNLFWGEVIQSARRVRLTSLHLRIILPKPSTVPQGQAKTSLNDVKETAFKDVWPLLETIHFVGFKTAFNAYGFFSGMDAQTAPKLVEVSFNNLIMDGTPKQKLKGLQVERVLFFNCTSSTVNGPKLENIIQNALTPIDSALAKTA